ncbi:MAG TPA: protein kinase [Thermoanaerobaculia bacterium]|nr:protein kinase [Thermoanaerobaculia bacterium]
MVQFRELTERYRLEKILKSTRGGTVLRATDLQSESPVAVKLIPLASPAVLETGASRFERLAATVAALRHPNLPTILDSGFSPDGNAFLVMELLEGWGLDSLTEAPPTRTLGLVEQALSGLEALAARGLAHGSVAPDNVFVLSTLEWDRVKLLGLGSAIFRDAAATGAKAARFRAPELAAPGAAPDVRSDIYSLALTACHALRATVGGGESPVVQMPLAVSFALENDEALRQVLERSLRQDPAERPSLREIREGIRLAVGNTATAVQAQAPAPGPASVTAPPPFLATDPAPAPALPVASVPAAPARPAAVSPEMLAVIPEAWKPAGVASAAAAQPAPRMTLPDPLPDLQESLPEPPMDAVEPAEDEVLSTVDDEVLNALLSVPPPGPWPGADGTAEAGATVTPLQQRPAAAPAPKSGILGRPAVLLGAAALVTVVCVVCVGSIAWSLLREAPEREAAAPPPIVRPRPSGPPASERLQKALALFEQGEDDRARLVLASFTAEDQASLRPDQCRSLQRMEEVLGLVALERLPDDLAAGLGKGDLGKLRTAVAASRGASGLPPEVLQELGRARSVVEIYGQARSAAAGKRHAEVLERFASLESLLPAVLDPEDLQNQAAAALEAEAAELVQEARYDQALARLDLIRRTWTDRDGLADQIEAYETHRRNQPEQERLLAALPGVERRKKPHEGLEALAAVEPTPNLAPRFAEVRKRLEAQIAQLDGQPPQVVLRDGYFLDFSRGAVVELSFRATDDYEVRSVKFMARPQGGRWREIPFEPSRSGYYTVEVPPAFHNNGPVDFYVIATDLSGHQGSFGTSDQPQQLKPQKGFERLVQ